MVLAACGSDQSVPTEPASIPSALVASRASSANGLEDISLYDDATQTSYHYDAETRQFSVDQTNGLQAQFVVDSTAVPVFVHAIENLKFALSTEVASRVWGHYEDTGCPPPLEYCPDYGGVSAVNTAAQQPTMLVRPAARIGILAPKAGPIPPNVRSLSFDPCTDIGRVIAANRVALRMTLNAANSVIQSIASAGAGGIEAGVPKLSLDPSGVVRDIVVAWVEEQRSSLSLSFTMNRWNLQGCGSKPILAWPASVGSLLSNVGSSPGQRRVCSDMVWEISRDGGITWTEYILNTCVYIDL